MEDKIIPLIQDPPARYRGKPFWSWNGKLEKEELLKQIDYLHEMGFGGFFIHSRTGLETEYLGDEWFDCVRACAEKAQSLGMETWLYDEDRWPSGTCGGEVTRDRKNRLRFISLYDSDEEAKSCKEVAGILARYAVKLIEKDGEKFLLDCYAVSDETEVKPGYVYAVFAEEEQECSDFYNGFAYIDSMSREVTELYLQSTHEKYYEKAGDLFGGAIKGVFTDEPHRGPAFTGFTITNRNSARMTPYNKNLPALFQKKYGRELRFPEIYWKKDGESYNETAAGYVDCLDDLFTQNFAKPCRDWCERHGLLLTGHILHEDSLSIQASVTGSCMRYYEYMDYPGIDVLTEENNVYWAAKQCASVARQLGKKFVLSELYGATGWDMTLDRYKTAGDWQAFYGINFRCQHLSWYTMKGEAKRDYPASILHQNAWYREWKSVEDYFARLALLSAEGERLCDVLVMVPIRETWGSVHEGWMSGLFAKDGRAVALDHEYVETFRALSQKNIDFDYGDEEILRKYGGVEKFGGKTYLKIGNARYAEVLWDPSHHYCEEARAILSSFAAQGGKLTEKTEELSPDFRIGTPEDVVCNAYRIGNDIWLFALNLDKKKGKSGALLLPDELKSYNAELWDFRTGESLGEARIVSDCGRARLDCKFEAGQEGIVRFTKKEVAPKSSRRLEYASPVLPERFEYELTEPNVLPLDEAVWYEDGIPQNDGNRRGILLIDRDIRKKRNRHLRGGDMLQPWFVEKYGIDKAKPQKLCELKLTFSFQVKDLPQTTVYLAIEETGLKCSVNGAPLGEKAEKHWVDGCFALYPIRLKAGENRVELCGDFYENDGLEAVYLLGEFGVELPNRIVKLPHTLSAGDICTQGLPYYSAAVKYRTGIREGSYALSFQKDGCAAINVYGGREKITLAFSPLTATVELRSELVIETVFNRRNTFGPLHQSYPQSVCEPGSFLTDGEEYLPFVPVPQGLYFTK